MIKKVTITNDKGVRLTKLVKGVEDVALMLKIVAKHYRVDYSFYRIESVEKTRPIIDDTQQE